MKCTNKNGCYCLGLGMNSEVKNCYHYEDDNEVIKEEVETEEETWEE